MEHYVFPAGGDGLYLAVDAKGTFRYNFIACLGGIPGTFALDGLSLISLTLILRDDNFTKALAIVNDATADGGSAAKVSGSCSWEK